LAPDFPVLFDFLDHWRLDIKAALHSLRIAHDRLIRLTEWRAVDGIITLQCAVGQNPASAKIFSSKILKADFPFPSSFVPGAVFGSGGT
jgi:hypothetical protein